LLVAFYLSAAQGLVEFLQLFLYGCQVAQYVESRGARSVGSYRAALQAQCKALLDSQHSRSMMQLQQLLEHEQWVVVEVPASFQHIVEKLALRWGIRGMEFVIQLISLFVAACT
jgi:hypothetical protein